MQKTRRNSKVIAITLFFLLIVLSASNVIRKDTLRFPSSDGLLLTADEYITEEDNPYILLFHQQQSSRGEYYDIARKLCKMDYNCLAVDIRNGGNDNIVSNETVKLCREKRCSLGLEDIEGDILSAINYAFEKSNKPVILFGSSANASHCLKIAKENENVRAVIALSPGEYFLPGLDIRESISDLKKPIFVSSSRADIPYMKEIVSGVSEEYVQLFEPQMGEGERGTLSLSNENENSSEYWLDLLLFFKDLR